MSGRPTSASPFHPTRPVPPGGILVGRKKERAAIEGALRHIADGSQTHLVVLGPRRSGRSSVLNFAESAASRCRVLCPELTLGAGALDTEADVATAIVTSVVIAIEAAGMLAGHEARRHAWIGQCARASVAAGSADPLLLTPGHRLEFHPDTLIRDLNVLADHARSNGGEGLLLRQDDIDALPHEARTVLETLLSCGDGARGWSLLLASDSATETPAVDTDVLELAPLTLSEIFRAASDAVAADERKGTPGVISRATASAIADATGGWPAVVAFCLHEMWVDSASEPDSRLSLSCSILRALVKRSDSIEPEQTELLFDRVDLLEDDELFGLHFLSSFEAMTEDEVNRLFGLILALPFGIAGQEPTEALNKLVLPPIGVLLENMETEGLVERQEGRFTTLSGNRLAKEYLSCRIGERGFPQLGSQLTYAASTTHHLVTVAALAGTPKGRLVAIRGVRDTHQQDESPGETEELHDLENPSVEELLKLGLRPVESVFGIDDLGAPGLLVGMTVQSCLDDGLSLADETFAVVAFFQGAKPAADELGAVADAWLEQHESSFAEARLKVIGLNLVAVSGDVADELRAVLGPSSVNATMFGAFLAGEYQQAADYVGKMLLLAERLRDSGPRAGAQLSDQVRDLRSRLVFLRAIVGDHSAGAAIAEQLYAAGETGWLDVYNRALLRGHRQEWVIAAEELSDLEVQHSEAIVRYFLLLHLPGMRAGRSPSHHFAVVRVADLEEVVNAQRLSFEAMIGRYSKSGYLSHVQGLSAPAARRTAVWTLATRYRDPHLAQTLLEQLISSDPASGDTYRADIADLAEIAASLEP